MNKFSRGGSQSGTFVRKESGNVVPKIFSSGNVQRRSDSSDTMQLNRTSVVKDVLSGHAPLYEPPEPLMELIFRGKPPPELRSTAKKYIPRLTSCTYNALTKEAKNLSLEAGSCSHQMMDLASTHYGSFLKNAHMLTDVRTKQLIAIDEQLSQMQTLLDPLEEKLEAFKEATVELQAEKQSFRNVSHQIDLIQELLEIPQLLDAAIRNQMWDETLDLLAFCYHTFKGYDEKADASEIPLMERLKQEVSVQRKHLETTLFQQLTKEVNLPTCVRLMGYMRRLTNPSFSEEELSAIFLRERRSFFEHVKQKWERTSGTVQDAAEILRMHACDVVTQYKGLFLDLHPPAQQWLFSQIEWFFDVVQTKLVPGNKSVDAATVLAMFRQASHASATLKRQGGGFISALMSKFEGYLDTYFGDMFASSLLTFQSELRRYDWTPSTAYTDVTIGHINCVELTRHRPVALFCNDIIAAFNELRQCPFSSLRASILRHSADTLRGAVNLIRECRREMELAPQHHLAEFNRMCRNISDVRPLVNYHLETIFGSDTCVPETVFKGLTDIMDSAS
eukprot:GEMP01015001.1.p1 GENE.GEMP01015001.1~~GEMP01015001.1.p1  ORF type:complete len:562 (-),score=96.56 GEMP01015001.1:1067-2752(-)